MAAQGAWINSEENALDEKERVGMAWAEKEMYTCLALQPNIKTEPQIFLGLWSTKEISVSFMWKAELIKVRIDIIHPDLETNMSFIL